MYTRAYLCLQVVSFSGVIDASTDESIDTRDERITGNDIYFDAPDKDATVDLPRNSADGHAILTEKDSMTIRILYPVWETASWLWSSGLQSGQSPNESEIDEAQKLAEHLGWSSLPNVFAKATDPTEPDPFIVPACAATVLDS